MNIVAIFLLRKPLTLVAYGLNGLLVLLAVYYWMVKFEFFGRIVLPLDSIIFSLIATTSVVALFWKTYSIVPKVTPSGKPPSRIPSK